MNKLKFVAIFNLVKTAFTMELCSNPKWMTRFYRGIKIKRVELKCKDNLCRIKICISAIDTYY